MSSDSEGMFVTQSNFKTVNDDDAVLDTDGVLNDALDMEKENIKPQSNFNIQSDIFSDVSEEEMKEISQVIEIAETEKQQRFAIPLHEGDLEKIVAGESCVNTENKTKWSLKVFDSWIKQRLSQVNTNEKLKQFSSNLLELPVSEIDEALSYFVAEVRNKNGEEYRPNTLYELIICIQHYLRENGRFVNILDDTEFSGLRGVLDARMKNLAKQGLGINKKQAEIITEEQEQLMWNKGVLGTDTPQKLLDTLLYQLGLNFALRAGQEHRNLRCGPQSQITVKKDSDGKTYLEYREDVSKTNTGGLLHRKITPKVTRAYENTLHPDRCPVKIYQKFMSLRPKNAKCTALYLRPKKTPSPDCWYCDSPVGVHVLQRTVGNLCEEAGLEGYFTNHSLRATAATRLYNAGFDEQLVAEKTGHRSSAIRSYKRTCDSQLANVSSAIQGSESVAIPVKKFKVADTSNINSNREISVNAGDVSFTLKWNYKVPVTVDLHVHFGGLFTFVLLCTFQ